MPAGRPSDYSPEVAAAICERIVSGASLRSICKADDMPSAKSVFLWLQRHKEFSEQYAIAMDSRSDALFEETIDIADDGSNDWMETNDPDNPGYRANGEHINRSRLRVDTRKWFISKVKPKKYGDRIQTVATDPDGNAAPNLSDPKIIEDVARRLAFVLSGVEKD